MRVIGFAPICGDLERETGSNVRRRIVRKEERLRRILIKYADGQRMDGCPVANTLSEPHCCHHLETVLSPVSMTTLNEWVGEEVVRFEVYEIDADE